MSKPYESIVITLPLGVKRKAQVSRSGKISWVYHDGNQQVRIVGTIEKGIFVPVNEEHLKYAFIKPVRDSVDPVKSYERKLKQDLNGITHVEFNTKTYKITRVNKDDTISIRCKDKTIRGNLVDKIFVPLQ